MLRGVALASAGVLSVAVGAPAPAKTRTAVVHAELRASIGTPRPADAARARGWFSASFAPSAARPRFLWTILFFDLTGSAVDADLQIGPADAAGRRLFTLCRPCRAGQSGSTTLTARGV